MCFRVRRASRALTRLYDEALEASGLTVTQFSILRTAIRMDGPTLNALADYTGHERTALWRTVQPLIRDGLAEMVEDGETRSRRIRATETGRTVVADATPAWDAAQARVNERLGDGRQAELIRLLSEVEALVA